MPFGEAAAAASAPALVRASAMAATAAVRFPLQRVLSAGAATIGAYGAYGASRGTASWISDRGGGAYGTATVRSGTGGTVNPGGGDPGGGEVTPAGSNRNL